jgi:hypothetical protein
VIESQCSSSTLLRFDILGDSNRSGIWLRLRLSAPNPTTLWGRTFASVWRFDLECGTAWLEMYTISCY